jgi:hypothetical protein
MDAVVVISAHTQHSRIFADGKLLVVVHALVDEGKQSDIARYLDLFVGFDFR